MKQTFLGYLRVDDSTVEDCWTRLRSVQKNSILILLTDAGNVMIMVLISKAKKQASKPDFWKSIQSFCMCHVPTTH